ncbi:MAG: hypothetical protein OXB88_01720 [Bacteriovoracales bacterium]|nr:hypothetical protein [Bacteriovoracales bacterium]
MMTAVRFFLVVCLGMLSTLVSGAEWKLEDHSLRYRDHSPTDPDFPSKTGESHAYLIRTSKSPPFSTALRDRVLAVQGKMNYYRYNPQIVPKASDLKMIKDVLIEVRGYLPTSFGDLPEASALSKMELDTASEIFAKVASIILAEPGHIDHFNSVLSSKKFYEGSPGSNRPLPVRSLPSPTSSSVKLLKKGEACSPGGELCQKGLSCVELESSSGSSCLDEGQSCSEGSRCCSGRCEFGKCTSNTRCHSCISEGGVLPSGSRMQCCSGLMELSRPRVDPFEENEINSRLCVARPERPSAHVSPPPPSLTPGCSFNKDEMRRYSSWFRRNERMLLAFEYLFGTVESYDLYGFMGSIKKGASRFKNSRISTKRSYELEVNRLMDGSQRYSSYESAEGQQGEGVGGSDERKSDALGIHYHEFYIQKYRILSKQYKERVVSYKGINPLLDESISLIQGFNWGKKRWWKKNKCDKWSVYRVRGANHKKCYTKSWSVTGLGSQRAAMGDFLRALESGGESGGDGRPQHLLAYPFSQCQVDPVFPTDAGLRVGKGGTFPSLSSFREKLKASLLRYGDAPIGQTGYEEGNDYLLPDRSINLRTERKDKNGRPIDLSGDLSDIVMRSMLSYGSNPASGGGKRCRSDESAKSKVQYLREIKRALGQMIDYYQKMGGLIDNKIISCLEDRKAALKEKKGDDEGGFEGDEGEGPEQEGDGLDPTAGVDLDEGPSDPTPGEEDGGLEEKDLRKPAGRPDDHDGEGDGIGSHVTPLLGSNPIDGLGGNTSGGGQGQYQRSRAGGGGNFSLGGDVGQKAFRGGREKDPLSNKTGKGEGDSKSGIRGKKGQSRAKGKRGGSRGPEGLGGDSSFLSNGPGFGDYREGLSGGGGLNGKEENGALIYDNEFAGGQRNGSGGAGLNYGMDYDEAYGGSMGEQGEMITQEDGFFADEREGLMIMEEANSSLNQGRKGDSLWERINKAYVRKAFPEFLIKKRYPSSKKIEGVERKGQKKEKK